MLVELDFLYFLFGFSDVHVPLISTCEVCVVEEIRKCLSEYLTYLELCSTGLQIDFEKKKKKKKKRKKQI